MVLTVPPEIMAAIEKKEEQKKKEKAQERVEERRENELEKKFIVSEKNLFLQKKELAQRIFSWANQFRQTKEWDKLKERRSVYGFRYVDEVTIDARSCDPRTGKKAYRPMTRFHVTRNGVAYEERYNWMGYTYDEFLSVEAMVKKLSSAYLALVLDHLESGKVFEGLIRWNKFGGNECTQR